MSRFLLLCMGVLFMFNSNLKAEHQLSLLANSDNFEEGQTVTFNFKYVQTEGTSFNNCTADADGWTLKDAYVNNGKMFFKPNVKGIASFNYSLALASTTSLHIHSEVGSKFDITYRENYFQLKFNVLSDTEVKVIAVAGNDVYQPIVVNVDHVSDFLFNVDLASNLFRAWIGTGTEAKPTVNIATNEPAEGYMRISNEAGSTSFDQMSMVVDYAYGLQFVINKPAGTDVPDVIKTNGQNVAIRYKHTTLPPLLYTSSPNSDGTQIFCEYVPSAMTQPIPYGAEYTLRWEETILSCNADFQNMVTVNLYNNEPFSITYECPCEKGTCFADSVVISAPARVICQKEGASLKLTANLYVSEGNYPYKYQWYKDGQFFGSLSASNSISVSEIGRYKVEAVKDDDPLCKVTSNPFDVYLDPLNMKPFSGCVLPGENKQVVLPTLNGLVDYEWSNGMSDAVVDLPEGVYNVVGRTENCTAQTIVKITADPHCDGYNSYEGVELTIPTFITPNGDGVNDCFEVQGIPEGSLISIFDRNGKKVAVLDDANPRWDGTYNGCNMPSSDYWYVVDVEAADRQYTGHFTLYRSR